MKISKYLFTTIFLFIFSSQAFAFNTNKYQVEMIIFSNLSKQSLNSEHWPEINPNIAIPNNVQTLNLTNQDNNSIQLLDPSKMQLNNIATKINNDPNHTVLAHFSWVQDFSNKVPPILLTASNSDDTQSLNGLIDLQRQHYFNTDYHLILGVNNNSINKLIAKDNNANLQNGNNYFLLDQKRRMRSKELNYIDYPTMGILVKITPIPKDDSTQ